MKVKPKAFMILELMISVFLFSILSILIFDFYKLFEKSGNELLELSIASDIIRRDIMCASPKALEWDEDNFVFKKGECVGFHIKNQILTRISGDYNFYTRRWIKKRSTPIAWAKDISIKFKKGERVSILLTGFKEKILIEERIRAGLHYF